MEQVKIKKGSVPLSVSVFDLDYFLAPSGREFYELTEEEQHSILNYIGIDTAVELEVIEVLHRTKTKPPSEPHFGKLITGVERIDEEWMLSGKCSLENRMSRHVASGHNLEMIRMSSQSNFTDEMINHMKTKRKRPEATVEKGSDDTEAR